MSKDTLQGLGSWTVGAACSAKDTTHSEGERLRAFLYDEKRSLSRLARGGRLKHLASSSCLFLQGSQAAILTEHLPTLH